MKKMKIFNIWKLKFLMSKKEKNKGFLLLSLIIISGFFETIGISSILPFMSLVSNPELINDNYFLNNFYNFLGFNNTNKFLIAVGISTLFLFILSTLIRTFTYLKIVNFAYTFEYSFSKRMLENYLRKPYEWYLNKNTTEIGGKVLTDIGNFTAGFVIPTFQGISQLVVCLLLLSLLTAVNPKVALEIFTILTILYLGIIIWGRSNIEKTGEKRVEANKKRYDSFSEIFGSVKEIKLNTNQDIFIQKYANNSKNFVKSQAILKTYFYLPRAIIEVLVFTVIILLTLTLLANKSVNINNYIPLLSLYAFASYRLLPAGQELYKAVTSIEFSYPIFKFLLKDYLSAIDKSGIEQKEYINFNLKNNIKLKNINYRYPGSKNKSLNSINMTFKVGSTTGIVGASGAGKTTLVDVLLGLLKKQRGDITIDDEKLSEKEINSLSHHIGYVPQNLYLVDGTIKSNIAFGVNEQYLKNNNVNWAAGIAAIDRFIEEELEFGYLTRVGEKGMRLSGGQRQRIAIARALYKKPKILILDEATSALDNLTEAEVLNNIKSINHNMVVIMIAHRYSSIKSCDNLYVLDKGNIAAKGTFNSLIKTNNLFNQIVGKYNPLEG